MRSGSGRARATRPFNRPRHHAARHPARPRHPTPSAHQAMDRVVEVFHQLGYSTQLGPQVESDFYNFEALNFPENHPARDTQDTLQIAGQATNPAATACSCAPTPAPCRSAPWSPRTRPCASSSPARYIATTPPTPPTRPIFHQVEGLAVGPDITFSDLKGTLDHAMRALFGSDVKTRFFPSFFPFTEPSADVQISCIFCGGKGCRKCKHSGWIRAAGLRHGGPRRIRSRRRRAHAALAWTPEPYTNVSRLRLWHGGRTHRDDPAPASPTSACSTRETCASWPSSAEPKHRSAFTLA